MLTNLRQLLPTTTCREISSILWSFAKMNLNPDDLVPGSVDSLAQQFVHDMDTANHQHYASLTLACANLQLDPCKGTVHQAIMQRLSTTDMSSFDAQAVSNITYSLAKMPMTDPSPRLLAIEVLGDSFLRNIRQPDEH